MAQIVDVVGALLQCSDVDKVCAHEVLAVQALEPHVDHRLHQAVVRLHVARAPIRPMIPVAADPAAIVRAMVGPMVPIAADPAAIVRALVRQVVRVAADPAAMVTRSVARQH